MGSPTTDVIARRLHYAGGRPLSRQKLAAMSDVVVPKPGITRRSVAFRPNLTAAPPMAAPTIAPNPAITTRRLQSPSCAATTPTSAPAATNATKIIFRSMSCLRFAK